MLLNLNSSDGNLPPKLTKDSSTVQHRRKKLVPVELNVYYLIRMRLNFVVIVSFIVSCF